MDGHTDQQRRRHASSGRDHRSTSSCGEEPRSRQPLSAQPDPAAAAEPPPEITKLRIVREPSICIAPQYAAEELLKAEGFVDVEYLQTQSEPQGHGLRLVDGERRRKGRSVAAGLADIHTGMVGRLVVSIDAGDPIRILPSMPAASNFGTDRVRSIKDLKGRTVAAGLGSSHYLYIASIAAYVGIDAHNDITFVTPPVADAARLLADGTIDAVLGFPPISQELARARSVTWSSIAVWTGHGRSTSAAC